MLTLAPEEAQTQAKEHAAQVQELFDRFAEEQRVAAMSLIKSRDAENERLDRRADELDEERRKFTEAAVQLGKEKAAFEVCEFCCLVYIQVFHALL